MHNIFSALLQNGVKRIETDFQLFPVIGAELEFYLHSALPESFFTEHFTAYARAFTLDLYAVTAEKGENQYEVALPHSRDIVSLAMSLCRLKELLQNFAALHNNKVTFDAKPYPNQPPSALHFHIHMEDLSGYNLCAKPNALEESALLYKMLGGLLETMQESMIYFSPSPSSYTRYMTPKETPSFVCWGGNNRTTALRLPETTHSPLSRRIEHRISSADACPYQALFAIIAALHYGITHNIVPNEKIYGNAYEACYRESPYLLQSLPFSFEAAQIMAESGKILQHYMS